jgi:hypothetical protein
MRTFVRFLAVIVPAALFLAAPGAAPGAAQVTAPDAAQRAAQGATQGAAQEAAQGSAQMATTEATQVAMTDATMDSTTLLRVERMGGFAGVHESWTLQASGQVWFMPVPGVAASLVRTLAADLMDEVRSVLGAGMGPRAGGVSGVECSDCFFYRVVVLAPGATRDFIVGEHRLAEASPGLRRLLGLVAGRGPPPFSLPDGQTLKPAMP